MTAYYNACLHVALLGVSLGASAQSFEGDWRGAGQCGSGSLDQFTISLSVRGTAVTGRAATFGQPSRDSVGDYNFEGSIDAGTGSVSLMQKPSGRARFEGKTSAGRMSLTGWNGYANCTFALTHSGQSVPSPTPNPTPVTRPTSPQGANTYSAAADQPRLQSTQQPTYPAANSFNEITAIQQAVSVLGYYRGSIDGIYGPGTRAAVEGWQRSQDLTPSGQLTIMERDSLKNQALAALGGARSQASVRSPHPTRANSSESNSSEPNQLSPPPVPAGHVFGLSSNGATRTVISSERQRQTVKITYRLTEENASEFCVRYPQHVKNSAAHKKCVLETLEDNSSPESIVIDCQMREIMLRGEPYNRDDNGFWWGSMSFLKADRIYTVACGKP